MSKTDLLFFLSKLPSSSHLTGYTSVAEDPNLGFITDSSFSCIPHLIYWENPRGLSSNIATLQSIFITNIATILIQNTVVLHLDYFLPVPNTLEDVLFFPCPYFKLLKELTKPQATWLLGIPDEELYCSSPNTFCSHYSLPLFTNANYAHFLFYLECSSPRCPPG